MSRRVSPVSVLTTISRTASAIGFLRFIACRAGEIADPVAEHGRSGPKRRLARLIQRRIGLEARHQPFGSNRAQKSTSFLRGADISLAIRPKLA
jgi:hypothetical protein